MIEEDLRNFTRDELDQIFVDLINRMEAKGDEYMGFYNRSNDKEYNIDKYSYATGLLTQVNRIKAMVSLKNSK